MARILLVHGAFHELWGPHEITARWLPALRDGLWHHGVQIHDADVAAAFYGDYFRPDPESDPVDGVAPWPGGVRRWVNVAALGDRACMEPRLGRLWGPRVEDHLVDNGHRAHDVEPYLNARVTGAAIAAALDDR